MEIKKFYLKYMFEGYVDNMPQWLENVAKKELAYIDQKGFNYLYKLLLQNRKNIKIADIGSGDCRIFKSLPNFLIKNPKIERYAYDIFTKDELPKHFLEFLQENNIQYHTIIRTDKYNLELNKKFDIIICLGTDCHLTNDEAKQYIKECKNHLRKNGVLIWQILRNDTIRANIMKYFSRIKYYTRNKNWYKEFFNDEGYKTKISKIYIYKQIFKD